MVDYLGLWVLVIISLNMWALLSVLFSGAGLGARLIWAAVLLVLPGLGFVAWYLLGPRDAVKP
mgnify:CR=1 FL=1